jgi:hypothetical protein
LGLKRRQLDSKKTRFKERRLQKTAYGVLGLPIGRELIGSMTAFDPLGYGKERQVIRRLRSIKRQSNLVSNQRLKKLVPKEVVL